MPEIEFTIEDTYVKSDDNPLWGLELTFTIEADVSKYNPGRTYGPPELCYPPEGGEVDITGVRLTDVRYQSGEMTDELKRMFEKACMRLINENDKLREKIEEELFEQATNDSYRDFDDYPEYE